MTSHNAEEVALTGALRRGRMAWHMSVQAVLYVASVGGEVIMSGDDRPERVS